MKFGKILANAIIFGMIGAIAGAVIGLAIGLIMCVAPACIGCKNEMCRTGNVFTDCFGTVTYVLCDAEFNRDVDYKKNMIYGAVICGAIGAIFGISFAVSEVNEEKRAKMHERWKQNRDILARTMPDTAKKIHETADQYDQMFNDVTYISLKQSTETKELMKQYQEKLSELDNAARKFEEETGEEKDYGNV